jgi:valyl-tRNA synthetase
MLALSSCNTLRYPLADSDSGEFLPVATTRPETILGDTAVAVNPADERFKGFVGRRVTVPMSGGRTIPVIADDYVDMEFGTGALKITPGGVKNDWMSYGGVFTRVDSREGVWVKMRKPYAPPRLHH